MEQARLFRLAPEALVITAYYEPASGWRLKVLMKRQDESWPDASEAVYQCLTSVELTDVICSEACNKLLDL